MKRLWALTKGCTQNARKSSHLLSHHHFMFTAIHHASLALLMQKWMMALLYSKRFLSSFFRREKGENPSSPSRTWQHSLLHKVAFKQNKNSGTMFPGWEKTCAFGHNAQQNIHRDPNRLSVQTPLYQLSNTVAHSWWFWTCFVATRPAWSLCRCLWTPPFAKAFQSQMLKFSWQLRFKN